MPEPINPRKRSLMPSGPLRRALRAAGHHLDPVLQVGKEGVTEAVLRALDAQLLAHELVKVKVGGESPEDRFEAAARLGEPAGAHVAQILGRTVLVYRRHPERPRFEPGSSGEVAARGEARAVKSPPRKGGKRTRRSGRRGGTPGGKPGAADRGPRPSGRRPRPPGREPRPPGRKPRPPGRKPGRTRSPRRS